MPHTNDVRIKSLDSLDDDGKGGHIQARSILGSIYDHTKGPRKLKGRSPEARA